MPFSSFDDPFRLGAGPSLNDIFRRHAGGHRAPRKPADPVDPEPEAAPLAEEEAQEQKAKVVLRNPKWEVEEVGFNEETDISIEADLPAEHAHKTKVAFELFAITPDGPESISNADGQIKDGKAKARIPVYIPEYKDEDFNLLKTVDFYFTAKHSESELFKDEKATKTVDHLAAKLLEVHVLDDVTFATDKSFIRPSQADALKALGQSVKDWRGKHPEGKLAVFGHADAVGQEEHNKKLSERRAKSIHAYLAKDPKPWEALYGEEKWGLATTQELLKHLGHDPGALDGQDGPKTQAAVKDFQGKKGLPATGTADAKTREALYLAFMEGCATPEAKAKEFDAIDGQPHAGCSEFNLRENTQGASEANRRVAVLMLKSTKTFPVQYPCKHGDVGPCRKQAARKGARATPGFKCLFYDQLVVEKKGGGVKPVPGKLKLVGVKEGVEIKQYVNLSTPGPDNGKERVLEVEVEGAADGTKVFWKVSAAAENSKRNSPKAGLKPDAKGKLVELAAGGAAELETAVKGGEASCVLACGLAGGDKFAVAVGLEKGKADGKFTVVNWRKLHYEILAPDFMSFEERQTEKGGAMLDFPAGMRQRIKDRLAKVFVEYELFKAHIFDKKAAPECSVFRSEQLGLPAGKPAYVLTDHTFKAYPRNFDKGMSPRSIGLKLCNKNYFFDPGISQVISKTYTLKSPTFQVKVLHWYGVFFLPKSAADGKDSVKSIVWRALVDPKKHPNHPGVAGGKPREGKLSPKDVEMISVTEFEIRLPNANPDDPGKFVGALETEKECPIEVDVEFEGAEEGLGLAGQGAQTGENLVVYNASAPDSFVDVLLHELGHSMGQTVYTGRYLPPKGYAMPKRTNEADPNYAHNGTKGHVYVGKEHSGSHCAYGLTDTAKAGASYAGAGGTCIMFGENDGNGPSLATSGFCPQCQDYIKARDLQDLSSLLE